MPPVERNLVKARAAQLRAHGVAAFARHLASEAGAVRRVLVEQPGIGRTEHFTPVEIDRGAAGDVVAARVTGHTARALVATALPQAA